MGTKTSAAWPVRLLDDQLALLLQFARDCCDKPNESHVHRLRTMSRRIEGQLLLLAQLPNAPLLKHTKRFCRVLKKIRRGTGEVRDLDMQIEHLAKLRTRSAAPQGKSDLDKLCEQLKTERGKASAALYGMLRKQKLPLRKMVRELLKQLGPYETFSLQPAALADYAGRWFSTRVSGISGDTNAPERLHAIRKAAKLARYMVENAGKVNNPAQRFAATMARLQEAGGRWHDGLTLVQVAAERLGEESPATAMLRRQCSAALVAYQRLLRSPLA